MRIQVFKSRNSRSNFGVIYDIQHFQRWNRPQAVRTDPLAALLGGRSAQSFFRKSRHDPIRHLLFLLVLPSIRSKRGSDQ